MTEFVPIISTTPAQALAMPWSEIVAQLEEGGGTWQALTGAAWNPKLHPRGHDGKFIYVGSIVHWLFKGQEHSGEVLEAEEHSLLVRRTGSNDKIKIRPAEVLRSEMPKATLFSPPDPWVSNKPKLNNEQTSALGGFVANGDHWVSEAREGRVEPRLLVVDKLASENKLYPRMTTYRGLLDTSALDDMDRNTEVTFGGPGSVLRTYTDQSVARTEPVNAMAPRVSYHQATREEIDAAIPGDEFWWMDEMVTFDNRIDYSPTLRVVSIDTSSGFHNVDAKDLSVRVEHDAPTHAVLSLYSEVGLPTLVDGHRQLLVGSDTQMVYDGFTDVGDTREYKIKVRAKPSTSKLPYKRWDGTFDPGSIILGTTMSDWTTDGKWWEEREKLHDQITAKMLEGVTPVEHPVWVYIAGGSSAGKTTVREKGLLPDIPDNAVVVDPDLVKMEMPEYQAAVAKGDKDAASRTHAESSVIAREGRAMALDQDMNIVADGIGNSDYRRMRERVAMARRKGYEVNAHYVTVPVEVALARNEARYKKTGRKVPEHLVKNQHKMVARTVISAIQDALFDRLDVWDTESDEPVKIAQMEGTDLQILDQDRWNAFVARAELSGEPNLTVHPIIPSNTMSLTDEMIASAVPGDQFVLRSTGEAVRISKPFARHGDQWVAEVTMSDGTRDYVYSDEVGLVLGPELIAII